MCLAVAIASAGIALFLVPPAKASWMYALLSAGLHVGYNLFLVRSYQAGELGQTYPIARGSSPLLIALAASVFAGERIGISALWGALMPLLYIGLRGANNLLTIRPGFITAFIGGLVFLLAYSIVIYAMSGAPMGAVSALCETSVLFAALISYFSWARH